MSTKIGKSSCSTRFTRNDSYRQTFLRGKRGLFGTRSLYCCSYCGRLLTRTQMQVDHCIPVEGAKSSRFVRTYIRLVGLFSDKKTREQGINGLWNLVPSCPKCNNKKSDKRGLWVVRGNYWAVPVSSLLVCRYRCYCRYICSVLTNWRWRVELHCLCNF